VALKLKWTEFAVQQLEEIFEYYRKKASLETARKTVNRIADATLILTEQPEIGQIEELLKNSHQSFRYLLVKNYKIIYWLNQKNETVEIIDVFDTRQNPLKLQRVK